jgi:energy-coupling factor transport system permease protein
VTPGWTPGWTSRGTPGGQVPRSLHPGAWWLWAIGLATAAARTTNPFLLLLVLTVAGFVVVSRRSDAPWARAYGFYLRMGFVVIAIRVVFACVFGVPQPGAVLVHLPEVGLPHWAAGVRLGGDVTAPMLVTAVYAGLQLATMLSCVGAANALANPKRLLQSLPGALYEVGVAVVVALSFSPQLVEAVSRIRAARRLRGRPDRGIRGLRGVAMPVLESALERSVELAAAMDARGFGRAVGDRRTRRVTGALTSGGLLGVCIGSYGLLDAESPPLLGLPLLMLGVGLAAAGLAVGGRRATRSRYRPDPWRAPEWLTTLSGVAAAATVLVVVSRDVTGVLAPAGTGLPSLPLVAAAGVLVAILPAWVTPATPRPRATTARTTSASSPQLKDVA